MQGEDPRSHESFSGSSEGATRSNAQQRALTGTTTRVSPRINNLQSDASQLAQLCKYLEEPVQDYERALAARSRGLLYGRSA